MIKLYILVLISVMLRNGLESLTIIEYSGLGRLEDRRNPQILSYQFLERFPLLERIFCIYSVIGL
jgi:hypothetical protein